MNRRIITCILLLSIGFLYAQEEKYIYSVDLEGYEYLVKNNNEYIYINDYNHEYEVLQKNPTFIDSSRYLHFKYKENHTIIIPGDRWSDNVYYHIVEGNNNPLNCGSGFNNKDLNIESIVSSSYLIENRIDKKYEYLPVNCILKMSGTDALKRYSYNDDIIPWAEGVAGSGIGEWITLRFIKPTNSFYILNGYVDFKRRNLYLENNRIKNVIIYYENNRITEEIRYEFLDMPYFSLIVLPIYVKEVRIVIGDIYKGTKYDDTCVSAIFCHPYVVENKKMETIDTIIENAIKGLKKK